MRSLDFRLARKSTLPPSLVTAVDSLPVFMGALTLTTSFLPFFYLVMLRLLYPSVGVVPLSVGCGCLVGCVARAFIVWVGGIVAILWWLRYRVSSIILWSVL